MNEEIIKLGTLSDKSVIAIKKIFTEPTKGDYSIVRIFNDGNEIIIEDDYITMEAAKENGVIFLNQLKEELK